MALTSVPSASTPVATPPKPDRRLVAWTARHRHALDVVTLALGALLLYAVFIAAVLSMTGCSLLQPAPGHPETGRTYAVSLEAAGAVTVAPYQLGTITTSTTVPGLVEIGIGLSRGLLLQQATWQRCAVVPAVTTSLLGVVVLAVEATCSLPDGQPVYETIGVTFTPTSP